MTELDKALVLRATQQIRLVVREAGDIVRMGPERALSAGMVQRNANERVERALRLLDGLVALCQGAGATAAAAEPPAVIGPVMPPGGETRRLYLLEHPDVALQLAREAEATKEAAERAANPAPATVLDAPPDLQKVIDQAIKAFMANERAAAVAPEPPQVWQPPPGFGRTDLEDEIVEDDLVAQLTANAPRPTPGLGAFIETTPVGPDPERPGWFPVGQIPAGVPIPATPSTFRPFEELDGSGVAHVTITRDELNRLEQAAAAADGRSYRPLPPTAPGIVTDDPAEYERILAQRGVTIPVGDPAAPQPQAAPGDLIEHSQVIERDVLDQAVAEAFTDEGELVVPCPDCGMQAKKWVGLQGHARSKHGFEGNRAQLKEWARGSGSSSSAA